MSETPHEIPRSIYNALGPLEQMAAQALEGSLAGWRVRRPAGSL